MKKKRHLYNKINSEELKLALANEPFERITASFYKYTNKNTFKIKLIKNYYVYVYVYV